MCIYFGYLGDLFYYFIILEYFCIYLAKVATPFT